MLQMKSETPEARARSNLDSTVLSGAPASPVYTNQISLNCRLWLAEIAHAFQDWSRLVPALGRIEGGVQVDLNESVGLL